MGRGLVLKRIAPFLSRAEAPGSLCGISSPFDELSRTPGLIIHVLRTRAPLPQVALRALDLHVLSAPPAFVLSQDQTLQVVLLKSIPAWPAIGQTFVTY